MSSNSASVARENGKAWIGLNRDELRAKFRHALLIEDEKRYAESVRDNLATINFETKIVNTIDDAEQELLRRSYPFIICDNIFKGQRRGKGSEFIRDQPDLLGGSQVILMTGYPESQIAGFEELKQRKVKLIKKGTNAADELVHFCRDAAEARAEHFLDKLGSLLPSLVHKLDDASDLENIVSDAQLIRRAKSYLINYLDKFPNGDRPQFFIMGEAFSPKGLIAEVEKGSEVSRELIDMLLDDILEPPSE